MSSRSDRRRAYSASGRAARRRFCCGVRGEDMAIVSLQHRSIRVVRIAEVSIKKSPGTRLYLCSIAALSPPHRPLPRLRLAFCAALQHNPRLGVRGKNKVSNDPTLQQSRAALTIAALGIVYGDIGTSPLYAVKETFNPAHGIPLATENILGGISAIFWALMVVVSLKYVTLVMRANNRGEGGIMALLALASSSVKDHRRWRKAIVLLGL